MNWQGTLHIGNHLNGNYKLFLSLREAGVDAHFVLLDRLAARHPLSDPHLLTPDLDKQPGIHRIRQKYSTPLLQKFYEWGGISHLLQHLPHHWPHAQTDFPRYVAPLARYYSAHSTGSDLRVEYHRHLWYRWAYRRARVVFFNNIDHYAHPLLGSKNHLLWGQTRHIRWGGTRMCFLPNIQPSRLGEYPEPPPAPDGRLRLLMPSRLTYFTPDDLKGHRLFFSALQELKLSRLKLHLTLATDDPQSGAFGMLCERLNPHLDIRVECRPLWGDRIAYLRAMAATDVVVDQFGLGAMGGVALDGFAAARPVLVHLHPAAFRACYGRGSPLPSLDSAAAIADFLCSLADSAVRQRIGTRVHDLLRTYHGPRYVADTFLRGLHRVGHEILRAHAPD